MYSPGSLNFAVVVALPLNGSSCLPPLITSTFGLSESNVTLPGPRNFAHASVTTGRGRVIGALVPLVYFASSFAHTGRASPCATVAVRASAFDAAATGP